MSSHTARRAARALASAGRRKAQASPLVRGADWRTATVATVGTDGTITTADGIPCRRMAAYSHPVVGDQVVISRSGSGNWRAEGVLVGAADTEWTSYTPAVTGGGSVAFSTADGWWKRMSGSLVYAEAYLVVGTAGTGASAVTVSLPSTPYRGSSSRRQVIPGHAGALTSSSGPCAGLVLAGGSGARVDQIQTVAGSPVSGAQLASGAIVTLNGLYREA